MKRNILIIEDEPSISFLLQQNLEFEGYEVAVAEDGEAGLEAAETTGPDLILLDLMLPKMSGMEVCKRLRSKGSDVPIIMLTARGQSIDKIMGLKNGADDYVTKPFDVMELSARIEAVLRRRGKSVQYQDRLTLRPGLDIDFAEHVVRREEEELSLTQQEAKLLQYLVHNEGQVLDRDKIMNDVWGHDYLLSSRTIDTHITHLRQKIEVNASNPKHIITVHRVGYKFSK